MAERKKPKPVPEAVRPENSSVGETLRAARLSRGIEIETVSQSIHIRPVQLKAIEENDIEALPGMTYAVGFVRSYANFLGLNGAEIVHRFKAEHGHSPAQSKLSFPEPIAESRVPDPMMVGVGAFLALVILVLWTVYSNTHSGSKAAEQIPPAPVVTSVPESLPPAAVTASTATPVPAPAATSTPALPPAAVTPVVTPSPEAKPTTALAPAPSDAKTEQPAATVPAGDQVKTADAAADQAKSDQAKSDGDSSEEDSASPEDDATAAAKPEAKKPDQDAVIKVKKGKSRITLKATQASWVQVTDGKQNVLYRKVLRPGEQYSVPDQPGLSLDTANAGGLDIVVDGKPVRPVGKPGEIVRGIVLDPKELKPLKSGSQD